MSYYRNTRNILDRENAQRRLDLAIEQHLKSDMALVCINFGLSSSLAEQRLRSQHFALEIAQFVRNATRSTDIVGHYLNDTVLLILPGETSRGGMAAATRLTNEWRRRNSSARIPSCTTGLCAGLATLEDIATYQGALAEAAFQAMLEGRASGIDVINQNKKPDEFAAEALYPPLPLLEVKKSYPHLAKLLETRPVLNAFRFIECECHISIPGIANAKQVAEHALELAERMALPDNQKVDLGCAALLKDVGMIQVPPPILSQKAPLTQRHLKVIHAHPLVSARRVKNLLSEVARNALIHHHERFDGKGYPARLRGQEIPVFARLIAVADAYEAMKSERAHRPALTPEQAQNELKKYAGTQFDAEVVQAFLGH